MEDVPGAERGPPGGGEKILADWAENLREGREEFRRNP